MLSVGFQLQGEMGLPPEKIEEILKLRAKAGVVGRRKVAVDAAAAQRNDILAPGIALTVKKALKAGVQLAAGVVGPGVG